MKFVETELYKNSTDNKKMFEKSSKKYDNF